MTIKRILVPVDSSPDSLSALNYACDFAVRFKADVVVLYVVEPIYYATPADMYATSPNLAMLMEDQRRAAKQQLAQLSGRLAKKGQRARALLKTGSAAQLITDTAKSTRASMIIMATHGRTGLAHVLMGSVAEKVVRNAPCPVLTLRRSATTKRKAPARRKK